MCIIAHALCWFSFWSPLIAAASYSDVCACGVSPVPVPRYCGDAKAGRGEALPHIPLRLL